MTSAKPHVLQVITHFDLGGAESVAISLGEALAGDVDFTFASVFERGESAVGRSMTARLDACGIDHHSGTRLSFKRGGLAAAGVRLAWLVDALRPDLVHLHTELPEASWSVASLLSRRVRQTPVLRTVHNTQLWPKWGAIGRWSERRLREARVVAVSQGALGAVQALRAAAGLMPFSQADARVILNGVDVHEIAERAPSSGRPRRALFAGRLEPQKGADLLPEIWTRVRGRGGADAELTIMGEGSLRPMLAAAFANDPSVTFHAPVPQLSSEIPNYDVLVMPSRFEGLPLIAVEALVAGVPIATFDIPGVREIFPAGTSLLSKAEDLDALASVLHHLLQPLHAHGFDGVFKAARERFSLARMAREYRSTYLAMLADGR